MAEKLSWSYEGNEEVACHKGYRIRAVHDDCPENPFEAWDGHWPMMVRYERVVYTYDKTKGAELRAVLDRFTDGQIVHDQKAITVAVGPENLDDVRYHMGDVQLEDGDAPKWITDADVLRDWFGDGLDNVHDSEKFDVWEKLYDLLGVPCLNTSSRGYSQGDYAELFIAATPEAQEQLRSKPEDMTDEEWKSTLDEDMDSQAKLYGYWAWGDCYGFIVEKPVPMPAENDEQGHCVECGRDNTGHEGEPCLYEGGNGDDCPMYDNGENVEWEEVEDGSCWGYYGGDHHESGLEEAALCHVPDDEAVTSRDKEAA